MHIAEDHVIFESVLDDNTPVAGEIQGKKCLITPLSNFALPLIRYELSDLVTVTKRPCQCGQCFARISEIEGRREERLVFTTLDGSTVEFGAIVLKAPLIALQNVKQFQLIHRTNHLNVRLVKVDGATRDEVQREVTRVLKQSLLIKGIALSTIEIEFTETIERPGSGAKERQFKLQ